MVRVGENSHRTHTFDQEFIVVLFVKKNSHCTHTFDQEFIVMVRIGENSRCAHTFDQKFIVMVFIKKNRHCTHTFDQEFTFSLESYNEKSYQKLWSSEIAVSLKEYIFLHRFFQSSRSSKSGHLKFCCLFFSDRFYKMKACADTYYIVVIEDKSTGQVIGSASLIKEQKFIHSATAVRLPFLWLFTMF